MLYTVGMLLALLLTLGLYVGGQALLTFLRGAAFLSRRYSNLSCSICIWCSLVLLTALFTGVFLALPDKRQRFVHVLPGAAGAACAWVIYSEIYSWYVNHIAKASALYGSLSVLLLMLLWLYACISILFYGALLNHLLFDRKEKEESWNVRIRDCRPGAAGQRRRGLRYNSVYCGLCRALYTVTGRSGALALTYDMTFLTLLFAALYEPVKERALRAACATRPSAKRIAAQNSPATRRP